MTVLDRLIPGARLVEIDRVDLAAPADQVWALIRHGNLPHSPIVRALFALRTIASRAKTQEPDAAPIRLDAMTSSRERPGFQILAEDPPHEVAVGAIGKVWRLNIPFVHVSGAQEYASFVYRGFVKVAWAMRVLARGDHRTRVELEVRVDATDDASWRNFRRYFLVIGPASRFIRRSLLGALAREFGRAAVARVDDARTGKWRPAP
jgi:hypothetical protein